MKIFKKMMSLVMTTAILMGFGAGINAYAGPKISEIFPDSGLQKIVKSEFDLNSDGYLSDAEIDKAKETWLTGVANLEGLQYLKNCKTVYVCGSRMPVVDLRRYTNVETCYILEDKTIETFIGGRGLKEVYINGSTLRSMSLQKSVDLKYFAFIYNTSFDGVLELYANRNLKTMMIKSVKNLSGIVFPQNAEVEKIMCSDLPYVRNIDISTSVKLSSLQCVYFEQMDVGSYRLSGEMFMLMCLKKEYAKNGQYIYLG